MNEITSDPPCMKHGKGPNHGKSKNAARKKKRQRHKDHREKVKDRAVSKSSHGKWTTVTALEKHRLRVSPRNH